MQKKLSSWLSLVALVALFTFEAAAQAPAPAAPGTPAAASGQMPGTIRAQPFDRPSGESASKKYGNFDAINR